MYLTVIFIVLVIKMVILYSWASQNKQWKEDKIQALAELDQTEPVRWLAKDEMAVMARMYSRPFEDPACYRIEGLLNSYYPAPWFRNHHYEYVCGNLRLCSLLWPADIPRAGTGGCRISAEGIRSGDALYLYALNGVRLDRAFSAIEALEDGTLPVSIPPFSLYMVVPLIAVATLEAVSWYTLPAMQMVILALSLISVIFFGWLSSAERRKKAVIKKAEGTFRALPEAEARLTGKDYGSIGGVIICNPGQHLQAGQNYCIEGQARPGQGAELYPERINGRRISDDRPYFRKAFFRTGLFLLALILLFSAKWLWFYQSGYAGLYQYLQHHGSHYLSTEALQARGGPPGLVEISGHFAITPGDHSLLQPSRAEDDNELSRLTHLFLAQNWGRLDSHCGRIRTCMPELTDTLLEAWQQTRDPDLRPIRLIPSAEGETAWLQLDSVAGWLAGSADYRASPRAEKDVRRRLRTFLYGRSQALKGMLVAGAEGSGELRLNTELTPEHFPEAGKTGFSFWYYPLMILLFLLLSVYNDWQLRRLWYLPQADEQGGYD